MTTFPELSRFQHEVDGRTIGLPLRGKVYEFPVSVSIDLGLKLTKLREEAYRAKLAADEGTEYEIDDAARELVDDGTSLQDLYLKLIGEDMLAQLRADGVRWPELVHIGETLFIYHTGGPAAALLVWQAFEDEPVGGSDAGPPSRKPANRSGSSRQRTSRRSSTKKKPGSSKDRRSDGARSSTRGR